MILLIGLYMTFSLKCVCCVVLYRFSTKHIFTQFIFISRESCKKENHPPFVKTYATLGYLWVSQNFKVYKLRYIYRNKIVMFDYMSILYSYSYSCFSDSRFLQTFFKSFPYHWPCSLCSSNLVEAFTSILLLFTTAEILNKLSLLPNCSYKLF